MVVIVTVLICALYLWVVDLILNKGMEAVFRGVRTMTETKPTAEKQWYIVHTYSGFEAKVKESLQQRAEALGMADVIEEILIPTEEVVEVRDGKKTRSTRKFFPGYVLVKMDDVRRGLARGARTRRR